MNPLLELSLKFLFILELANSMKIDPRLERIDRFLEQTYKMRNHRGLDFPEQDNLDSINEFDNHDGAENKFKELDLEQVKFEEPDLDQSNFTELVLDFDSKENANVKEVEKFHKQASQLKLKPKNKNTAVTKVNDEEEDYDEKQPELVPIPHPIPIVIQKLIPMPLIVSNANALPFSMLPMSLQNVQSGGFMNQFNTHDRLDNYYVQQARKFMPNMFIENRP